MPLTPVELLAPSDPIAATPADTATFVEALTASVNPLDFLDTLTVAALINGGAYRFLDTVHIAQATLPDFSDTITTRGGLPDFMDRIRTQPNIRSLFTSPDIHRPVGRVQEA